MSASMYEDYEDVPRKVRAVGKIAAQPFFGRTPLDVVLPVYMWTHMFWIVGTWEERRAVFNKCMGEHAELLLKYGRV